MDLARLVVKLEAQTAEFMAKFDAAEKRSARLENQLDRLKKSQTGSVAFGSLIAEGVERAADALFHMGKEAVENADHLNKLSQQTGISVENLSRLQHAANLANVDVDTLGQSLAKMSKGAVEAAQGTGTAKKAYDALGISVKNQDGTLKSQQDLLFEVADKFSHLSDGATKSALAQEIFSKGGARMIPLLNQGSAGLREMAEESDKLGLTLSAKTAAAAEEFNDNLTRIKGVAQGLVLQFIKEALPTLEALSSDFLDTAKSGDKLSDAAQFLGNVFKVLASGGVIVAQIFQTLGKGIAAQAAIIVELSQGNFRQAARIAADAFGEAKDDITASVQKIAKIWGDQVPKVEEASKKIDGALDKTIIFNDEAAEKKAKAAADAAIKALREMSLQIDAQVNSFGKGEVALVKYRIAHGDLAEKVKIGGAAAQEFADKIVESTVALEKLKNADAVAQIDQQIMELTGHTREAAEVAFDLQNKILKASLADSGDTAGLEKLETLKKLLAEQARFNELEVQSEKIRDRLAEQEERIAHDQEVGAISQLDAMAKISAARQQAVEDLTKIQEKQDDIAKASENPQIEKATEESRRNLEKLAEQTDLLGDALRRTFEDAGGDALGKFLKGEETALGAVKGFFRDLEQQALDFIAKDIFRQIANSVFGTGSAGGGGGGGGWLKTVGSFFGSLFGSTSGAGTTMDSGGESIPGRPVLIGRGAQPEWFVPQTRGTFMPRGMGGTVNNVNVSIAAPTGTVTRATQLQTAAQVSRGIALASRRNN